MLFLLVFTLGAVTFFRCARELPPPTTGAMLYHQYCASYHGPTGNGDGPVAPSLQHPPADLTTVARRTGGRFDAAAVMAVIDRQRAVAAHGPRDMPVWSTVFEEELKGQSHTQYSGFVALTGAALGFLATPAHRPQESPNCMGMVADTKPAPDYCGDAL